LGIARAYKLALINKQSDCIEYLEKQQ
jgi:hypothetical protein